MQAVWQWGMHAFLVSTSGLVSNWMGGHLRVGKPFRYRKHRVNSWWNRETWQRGKVKGVRVCSCSADHRCHNGGSSMLRIGRVCKRSCFLKSEKKRKKYVFSNTGPLLTDNGVYDDSSSSSEDKYSHSTTAKSAATQSAVVADAASRTTAARYASWYHASILHCCVVDTHSSVKGLHASL